MTETTTTKQPAEATTPGVTTPNVATPVAPADVLLNLIVLLLAPIFLDASGGNIAFARLAALETVTAYRARNNADLIAVAQIIAFGLAALGSLSLSMADDISLSMTLRLRGNANALNRSAEQNRRAISQFHGGTAKPQAATPPQPEIAETKASPPPQPESAAAPQVQPQHQAAWAAAMAKVATEVKASLPGLPSAQRYAASMRAAALSSTASDLLCGTIPTRLKPGALSEMMPPRVA